MDLYLVTSLKERDNFSPDYEPPIAELVLYFSSLEYTRRPVTAVGRVSGYILLMFEEFYHVVLLYAPKSFQT